MCFGGLSRSVANEVVAVASRADELPVSMGLFEQGRLTFHQVAVIARYAPARYDAHVAQLAEHCDVGQLSRALSRYVFQPEPEPEPEPEPAGSEGVPDVVEPQRLRGEEAAALAPARLSSWFVGGRYHLEYDAPAAEGAVVEQALCEAKDGLFHLTRHPGMPPRQLEPGAAEPAGDSAASGRGTSQDGTSDRLADTDATATPAAADVAASVPAAGEVAADAAAAGEVAAVGEVVCVRCGGVHALVPAADCPACVTGQEQDRGVRAAVGVAPGETDAVGKPRVTLADAFLEIAHRALRVGCADTGSRAEAFRVLLHLDAEGRGWLHRRGAVPRSVWERLTCDGQVIPVTEREGRPVDVGRTQRVVPRRVRRLIEDRDRGCRVQGCGATRFVEVHHVVHWAKGGPTDWWNLISLCPFHHDALHRGEFTIIALRDPHRSKPTSDPAGDAHRDDSANRGTGNGDGGGGGAGGPNGAGGDGGDVGEDFAFYDRWGVRLGFRATPPLDGTTEEIRGAPPYCKPTFDPLIMKWVDLEPPRHPPPTDHDDSD
ncbi:hypothetical protein GCM10027579_17440 [Calidifontibacter terrae]